MRILILSDDFPPRSFGGAGFSTFYLACGLKKAGHQVFVITTCREKSPEEALDYQGLKIFRIFSDYHPRYRSYLSLYNPQTAGKISKLIEEINPDIIHAHNIHHYLSFHCLKTAKRAKKPVFWTARDTMAFTFGKLATQKYLERGDCKTSWLDHLKQAQKRYNPFRNIIIRYYLKYVDKIFSVGYALKDALNQNGIQNVEVIYSGIDVDDWQASPQEIKEFKEKYGIFGKKIIFFGARLSYLKGGEQLVRTVAKIKKDIPTAALMVAGEKKGYAKDMEKLAKELNVEDDIIFTGWLEKDEMKTAYHSADVVAMPSIYFEPLGRAALEGMACKKPVVATCYGGAPEVVKDNITGYTVNPLNVELMANKVGDLLKNPQKAREFGEAGYQRAKKHFNLDSHIAKTVSWYQKYL